MSVPVAVIPSDVERAADVRSPAFVGRTEETAALRRALAGPAAVVLVEGEAGIGKSRLLAEFLAQQANQRVLAAACPPFQQPHTLGPLVDALRETTEPAAVAALGLSPLAGALRPLFPEWAAQLPDAPDPAEDATAARHRLFRALDELMDRLGLTLLALDDAHWADAATLDLLLYLVSRRQRRISLVVTYRPEDLPDDSALHLLATRLPPGTTGVQLTLGPLDAARTAEFVSSMLENEPVSSEFAEFLHQRTDGVPLALEESVRLMGERADLIRFDGEWMRRRRLADIDVPRSIRAAVLERVRRVDDDARAVLRAAAVLVDPATEDTLVEVAGLTRDHTRAGLARALDTGLLREDHRGLVAFRHALVCRAVYEDIRPPDRRVLHGRAGRALELAPSPPLARQARHFRAAGETEAWCEYTERAADAALAAGDETAAGTLLHELIVEGELPAATALRLARKVRFGAHVRVRQLADTLRAISERPRLDRVVRAELRFEVGRALMAMQDYGRGSVELEQAIRDLGDDHVEAVRAMATLGSACVTSWPASKHLRWLRRAQAAATTGMTAEDRLWLRVNTATGLLQLGKQEGWEGVAELPDSAAAAAERVQIVRGRLNVADAAVMWGRHAEADRHLASALELAERHQYWWYLRLGLVVEAHSDWFVGRWAGLAERAARLADDEDVWPLSRLEARLVVGRLSAAEGRYQEALDCLRSVHAGMGELAALEYVAESAAALARLMLGRGRVADALEVTAEPAGAIGERGLWLWGAEVLPARVDALVAAERIAEAQESVADYSRWVRRHDVPSARAALALCRGIIAEGRDDPGGAITAYTRAAAAWRALPREYDALLVDERRARCEHRIGRHEDGLATLRAAHAALGTLGAQGDASRVADLLRDHGDDVGRPRGGRPSYGDQLSPRELDVARLLVNGLTNREMAQRLFLSPKTVARHLDSARRKLRAPSRTALVARLVDTGVVPLTGAATDGSPPRSTEQAG